jgi:Fe-S cluster biogenesis protein NfuA
MNDLLEQARAIIDAEIKPAIEKDGGTIHLHSVDEQGIAWVQMNGACAHCSASSITLKAGVERILRRRLPLIKGARLLDK